MYFFFFRFAFVSRFPIHMCNHHIAFGIHEFLFFFLLVCSTHWRILSLVLFLFFRDCQKLKKRNSLFFAFCWYAILFIFFQNTIFFRFVYQPLLPHYPKNYSEYIWICLDQPQPTSQRFVLILRIIKFILWNINVIRGLMRHVYDETASI